MLVVRKPSRETDLGRKSFVPCDRRGSGLHISEIRRRAENPLAAKKQCVRYSHPIVSQNQTKSDGAKTPVCISNRKKLKCHLSRCVTNSYVDMRMRQPDSSDRWYEESERGEVGDEQPTEKSRESRLRREIRELKRLLAEKTLEADFFKGALQRGEARHR